MPSSSRSLQPVTVGDRVHLVVRIAGRRVELDGEITLVDEGAAVVHVPVDVEGPYGLAEADLEVYVPVKCVTRPGGPISPELAAAWRDAVIATCPEEDA